MLVQSPYDMAHHPIFRVDARRVQYAQRVWPYSRRMLLRVHVILALTVLGIAVFVATNRGLWAVQEVLQGSLAFAIFAIILAGGGIDFASISSALPALSGEVVNGRWDLLRLTSLNDWGIVRAKHAAVRLRVWRATAIIVSVRIATITLGLLIVFLLPLLAFGDNRPINSLLTTFVDDPLGTALALLVFAITLVVYVLEPIWRMQAMTAVGLWLSARIMNHALAMMAGFATIVVVWVLQAVIALALIFGLGFLSSGLVFYPYYDNRSAWPISLYLLLCCIITSLTIYGFYAILQSVCLRRVSRRIRPLN